MEIGIIGLPKSGKTTIFNALTKGKLGTSVHSISPVSNVGVVKVPDPRLYKLSEVLKPKRTVHAEIAYTDVAAPMEVYSKQSGSRGQFLSILSSADALVHVVRAYKDERIPHCAGTVDPLRDIETINMELALSDIAVIEKRLDRLQSSLKGVKQPEREKLLKEQTLISSIKSNLENEIPIREQNLSEFEKKVITDFQFLTIKPMLLVINIGEDQLRNASVIESQWDKGNSFFKSTALCGQLEMELAQLSDIDAEEFRANMGLTEPGLNKMIRLSYDLLGLITFFTTVSNELKAWTIRKGTTVQKAAGKIHTDIERGFIRAEVISYNDMIECSTLVEAKKRGILHIEGKNYIVKDGDIITILFNI